MQTLLVSRRALPSVLMWRDVRISANSVALNMTVPSLLRGMFIDTSLCNHQHHQQQCVYVLNASCINDGTKISDAARCYFTWKIHYRGEKGAKPTLQATRWGHSLPKPSGGEILRSRATTSRCLMRPLQPQTESVSRRSGVNIISLEDANC